MNTKTFSELLASSAALHRHLCPRQVLGVRMGLAAGEWLQIDLPQTDKQLYTIIETDGCAADGVSVATNCWVGKRTLRVEDFGKVAATFIDTCTQQAIRITPSRNCRQFACRYAEGVTSSWEAMLIGYQLMPVNELLDIQPVMLTQSLHTLLSQAGKRTHCDLCGEEIINEREIYRNDLVLCRACAGGAYYKCMPAERLPMKAELLSSKRRR
jgi:formylmethanofuran dehydrogenase subunit E